MKTAKELKEALRACYPNELINLLAKVYRASDEARKEIDAFLIGNQYTDIVLAEVMNQIRDLPHHSAGEIKTGLAEYMKHEKDKQKRIEVLFFFIENTLESYSDKKCDHRLVMLASSSYGKAMKMMDKKLWDTFFDRSYSIAERFYSIPMEAGTQAVRYYQEVKNKYMST